MNKPTIGVATSILNINSDVLSMIDRVYVNRAYVESIEKAGGIVILIPVTTRYESLDFYVNLCDGFVFPGGNDINPKFYKDTPHPMLGVINDDVDNFQFSLIKKVILFKKPFLGICRGSQVLNVALGGTLYQDIASFNKYSLPHVQKTDGHLPSHTVSIVPNSTLYKLFGDTIDTNSFHHQSIKKLGKDLFITAKASDGVIEGIQLKNYTFGIGVQWHPELMFANTETMGPLFKELINSCFKTNLR